MARRNNRYSIRKFTIGTASVLLGSLLIFQHSEEAQADTLQKEQQEVKEIPPKVDKENTNNDSNFNNILEKRVTMTQYNNPSKLKLIIKQKTKVLQKIQNQLRKVLR